MSHECPFCQIIQGQLLAKIVFEDEKVLAFKDKNPQAPVHLLIIPKKHYFSLNEMPEEERELLGQMIFVARQLAEASGLKTSGYRLVINTGPDSGQQVFHLHLHLLGGRPFSWPPG